ncbi:hypothetical protein ABT341_10585 [Pseudonocardia alni]|uniref:hypothetical protein n=1 Tax=Pseudonocardia alni TaxID=33907 RepID=UPI003324872D
MLYIGPVEIPGSDDHEGFVSADTADGRATGIWSDARRAPAVAYRAACECGWRDDVAFVPDRLGHSAALRAFVDHHFTPVTGSPALDPMRHFLPAWAAVVGARELAPAMA